LISMNIGSSNLRGISWMESLAFISRINPEEDWTEFLDIGADWKSRIVFKSCHAPPLLPRKRRETFILPALLILCFPTLLRGDWGG
jgi:hypothetical protein